MLAFCSATPLVTRSGAVSPARCAAPPALSMIQSDHHKARRSRQARPPAPGRTSPPPPSPPPSPRSASPPSVTPALPDLPTTPPLRLTGNNIHLTDSLHTYVSDKLGKVTRRFSSIISKMDVHLTVDHNPSNPNANKCEVVAFSGKNILRTEVRADDMYAAIDVVETRIARTIRKFKERKEARYSKAAGSSSSSATVVPDLTGIDDADADADADGYQDVYGEVEALPGIPAVSGVVRRKVFPMPLQTVEEAVLCCEYVDHPWYLFRNAATNEISLVYKRNHGGYGLIEPSNPDIVDEEEVMS